MGLEKARSRGPAMARLPAVHDVAPVPDAPAQLRARALAAQGASIVIADLKDGAAAADRLRAKGHKAAHVDADVSSEEDTQRMARAATDAFGKIDILVNNAAIYSTLSLKPFEQLTVADLMGETRLAYSRSFDFQSYIWAAVIYLALVEALRIGIDRFERVITRHLKR